MTATQDRKTRSQHERYIHMALIMTGAIAADSARRVRREEFYVTSIYCADRYGGIVLQNVYVDAEYDVVELQGRPRR